MASVIWTRLDVEKRRNDLEVTTNIMRLPNGERKEGPQCVLGIRFVMVAAPNLMGLLRSL